MVLDIDMSWVATTAASALALVGGMYAKTIRAESKVIANELKSLESTLRGDVRRLEATHSEMWKELKEQKEETTQNKEAMIKLTSSIDRANELLIRIEDGLSSKVGKDELYLQLHPGRRWSDREKGRRATDMD